MLSQNKKKLRSYKEVGEVSVQYVKYFHTVIFSVIRLCSTDLKKKNNKPCENNLVIQGPTLAYLQTF